MPGTSKPADESFGTAVVRLSRPIDAVAVASVPVVLAVAYLLHPNPGPGLVFTYTEPTVRTAVTANFVHVGPEHLLSNLVSYTLAIATVYVLSALAEQRHVFYTTFVAILVAFPLVLSVLNLAVPREGAFAGASGLVMAVSGLLPVSLGGYLDRRFGFETSSEVAGFLFLVGLAITALLAVPDGFGWIAVPAVVGALGYAVSMGRTDTGIARLRTAPSGFLEFAVWSVGLFVFLLVAAFPAGGVVDGTIVNTYTHFLGYALGFLGSYLMRLLTESGDERRAV